MKKTDPPFSSNHPDDLLVPYLERKLGPEDSEAVGEHLDGCPECRAELEELRRLLTVLQTEKKVFCPEVCSLYEFAVNGADPGQIVSKHLDTCESCREEVAVLRAAKEQPERMDQTVWAQIQERLPKTVPATDASTSPFRAAEGFFQGLFARFSVPKLAAAAAAAMILVFAFLQPWEAPQPMVAVSSVAWENSPKPKSPDSVGRKRVAMLILLKDFEKAPSQKMIDNLYQALEPGLDINERYNALTPAELKNAVKRLRFSEESRKHSLEKLRKDLGVSVAVLVTVSPVGDKFGVRGEMRDTATDRVMADKRAGSVSSADLPSKIREIVQALMLQQ